MRLKKLLCLMIGHRFNSVESLISRIKLSADNSAELEVNIVCATCGEKLEVKEKGEL